MTTQSLTMPYGRQALRCRSAEVYPGHPSGIRVSGLRYTLRCITGKRGPGGAKGKGKGDRASRSSHLLSSAGKDYRGDLLVGGRCVLDV